jgi:hypothetical protein
VTVRRFPFRLEIAGHVLIGEAAIEGELEERIGRDQVAGLAALSIRADEPPRGRPSFDCAIAEAVEALGPELEACSTGSERVRSVLRRLATTCAPADIPKYRTVEVYLSEHWPTRKKERRKSRRKSNVVNIAPVRRSRGC